MNRAQKPTFLYGLKRTKYVELISFQAPYNIPAGPQSGPRDSLVTSQYSQYTALQCITLHYTTRYYTFCTKLKFTTLHVLHQIFSTSDAAWKFASFQWYRKLYQYYTASQYSQYSQHRASPRVTPTIWPELETNVKERTFALYEQFLFVRSEPENCNVKTTDLLL